MHPLLGNPSFLLICCLFFFCSGAEFTSQRQGGWLKHPVPSPRCLSHSLAAPEQPHLPGRLLTSSPRSKFHLFFPQTEDVKIIYAFWPCPVTRSPFSHHASSAFTQLTSSPPSLCWMWRVLTSPGIPTGCEPSSRPFSRQNAHLCSQ